MAVEEEGLRIFQSVKIKIGEAKKHSSISWTQQNEGLLLHGQPRPGRGVPD
uniref:Uncharacterized protein n=1 Tax=Anguilla anguilla TaxID=7936 RepID=A0A0E9VVW1_ANGAN